MRVVLASQAATGHVHPLMPWAQALRDAGHEVHFTIGAELVPWLEELGFRAHPVGESIPWALARVQERFPDLTTSLPAGEAWKLDLALFADVLPRSVWPATVEALEQIRPDVVIYEASNLGAVLAAAQLGLPAACCGLWAVGRWHVDESVIADRILALWSESRADPLPVDPLYGTLSLDPSPPSLRAAGAGDRPALRRMPTRQVPWGDARAELPPWVGDRGGRPLVYLTLGTVGWGSVDILRAAARGLARLPVDVLVAVGPYFDPVALGDLPDSVHVGRFVRQDLLLPHLAAAVHHAGSGTLLGACGHGVPQVVIPLGADQFQNADALVGAGAGIAVARADADEDAVERAARELLDDPRFGASARRLAEEIDAMPAPVDRLADLQALTPAR
jgi:UDP:flavonoid glycosyltransferase YjiC (YdhE family)